MVTRRGVRVRRWPARGWSRSPLTRRADNASIWLDPGVVVGVTRESPGPLTAPRQREAPRRARAFPQPRGGSLSLSPRSRPWHSPPAPPSARWAPRQPWLSRSVVFVFQRVWCGKRKHSAKRECGCRKVAAPPLHTFLHLAPAAPRYSPPTTHRSTATAQPQSTMASFRQLLKSMGNSNNNAAAAPSPREASPAPPESPAAACRQHAARTMQ